MGHRIAKAFPGRAQSRAESFRQTVLQLLNPRLRTINFRLRILLVQTLRHALLARHRALDLGVHRHVHALAQALQYGLLTRQAQLRVLLL